MNEKKPIMAKQFANGVFKCLALVFGQPAGAAVAPPEPKPKQITLPSLNLCCIEAMVVAFRSSVDGGYMTPQQEQCLAAMVGSFQDSLQPSMFYRIADAERAARERHAKRRTEIATVAFYAVVEREKRYPSQN